MKAGGIVNFITIGGLWPGAKQENIDEFTAVIIYGNKRRTFTRQLLAQLPSKEVLDYIKAQFDTPE